MGLFIMNHIGIFRIRKKMRNHSRHTFAFVSYQRTNQFALSEQSLNPSEKIMVVLTLHYMFLFDSEMQMEATSMPMAPVPTVSASVQSMQPTQAARSSSSTANVGGRRVHATAVSHKSASLTHFAREQLKEEVQVAAWLSSRDLHPSAAPSASQRLEQLRARRNLGLAPSAT